MNLAMANGFSAVGFTELNEQEMMWVDGGDAFDNFLNGVLKVCNVVIRVSVDALIGLAVTGICGALSIPAMAAGAIGLAVAIGCELLGISSMIADAVAPI